MPVNVSQRQYQYEGTLVHQTDKAFLVSDGDKETWIPKSLCIDVEFNNGDISFYISEKMAIEKGLV